MNLRDKLVASIETAASDVISIRTVMKRVGGAALLRSLPTSDAKNRMMKAAREIQNERRTGHRHKPAPKIDTQSIAAWCKKNTQAKVSASFETAATSKTKTLETGLTRKEAMKAFPWKSGMGDCRGFSYDPKTGKAKWV